MTTGSSRSSKFRSLEFEGEAGYVDTNDPVTRIVVIHDDNTSAVYDISEIRIAWPVAVTIEHGQLVIRPLDE